MSEPSTTGRKPWVAVVLSLLCTGLGHIYCGRIVTGSVLFLVSLLSAPLMVLVAHLSASTAALVGLILWVLAVMAVYLYAVVSAFLLARRSRDDYVLKDYNRGLVYALFIFVGVTYPVGATEYLRANVFEGFVITNESQAPNVLGGDRIAVNKVAYPLRSPERGEVVVFRNPINRQQTFIKRVIALPGDRVMLRANEVYINGKKLERYRVPASSLSAIQHRLTGEVFQETNLGSRYRIMLGSGAAPADYPESQVPEGNCFVLGDNRANSQDSRRLGFVPLGDILGVVQYIYYPAETWARFGVYQD